MALKLSSISRPLDGEAMAAGELEGAVMTVPGYAGVDAEEVSRSVRHLVVRGKGEPIGRRGGVESIIGVDERTRILDTELAPWRMICALRMRGRSGGAIGTGWFVGPKTLITAGHCVYDETFFGGWALEIEVSPGRNGAERPYSKVTSRRFSTLDRWKDSRDPDFDIGAIHLDEPLGEKVGWFSTAALLSEELTGYLVNISGYPGDRGAGQEQWFHRNRILTVAERRIYYDVDTYGGQSGAPVFIYADGSDEPLVVGIHAYGIGGTPANVGIPANSAPKIIPEVLEQIQAWIKEADKD